MGAERRIEDCRDSDCEEDAEREVPDPAGRKANLSCPDQVKEVCSEDQDDYRHVLHRGHPEADRRPGKECIPRLLPLEVVEKGDEEHHREEDDEGIVPEEP